MEDKQVTIDMLMAERPPDPEPEARALTLDEVSSLKMSAPVWIEERRHPWNKSNAPVLAFFRLFPATYIWTGIPIGKTLRVFHFRYEYTDRRAYDYKRSEAFYGKEWRVWTSRPTDEQKEAEPWKT